MTGPTLCRKGGPYQAALDAPYCVVPHLSRHDHFETDRQDPRTAVGTDRRNAASACRGLNGFRDCEFIWTRARLAAAAWCPAADYRRFCQTLLNGGELDGVRIPPPATLRQMTTNALPPDVPIAGGTATPILLARACFARRAGGCMVRLRVTLTGDQT
jgi:hypothetical protein